MLTFPSALPPVALEGCCQELGFWRLDFTHTCPPPRPRTSPSLDASAPTGYPCEPFAGAPPHES